MTLIQHKDYKVRFDQQVENSREYVLPFIEKTYAIKPGMNIFEMGCGEGGVLLPFAEKGCYCLGVDLDRQRIEHASELLAKEVKEGKIELLYKNVFDTDFFERFKGSFDIIILKDVIEHLPEQEKFVPYLKQFLNTGGQIFFGFPPWYMPFGGHQQISTKKIGMMPWYHILPRPVYKGILKMIGEDEGIIQALLEVYDTRISIERFERIIRNSGLKVLRKQHFLFNPIYKYKFGVKARKQWEPITKIPFFRNFVTTCVYYTVG